MTHTIKDYQKIKRCIIARKVNRWEILKIIEEDLEIQTEAFESQISIANNHNLPIVIHCRESFDEIYNVHKEATSAERKLPEKKAILKDKVNEFLFVLGQAKVRGAVQMIINPVAIRWRDYLQNLF